MLSFSVLAQERQCSIPLSDESFADIVNDVRHAYFPELARLRIPIRHFHQAGYYLQAGVNHAQLLIGKKRYHLDVNPEMLACPPNDNALRAILVHEFEHFRDYHRRSASEVVALGIRYATSRGFRARYERRTDEKVLRQHLGTGLHDYRLWLYQLLPPKQLRLKRIYYYTPSEIDNWVEN